MVARGVEVHLATPRGLVRLSATKAAIAPVGGGLRVTGAALGLGDTRLEIAEARLDTRGEQLAGGRFILRRGGLRLAGQRVEVDLATERVRAWGIAGRLDVAGGSGGGQVPTDHAFSDPARGGAGTTSPQSALTPTQR